MRVRLTCGGHATCMADLIPRGVRGFPPIPDCAKWSLHPLRWRVDAAPLQMAGRTWRSTWSWPDTARRRGVALQRGSPPNMVSGLECARQLEQRAAHLGVCRDPAERALLVQAFLERDQGSVQYAQHHDYTPPRTMQLPVRVNSASCSVAPRLRRKPAALRVPSVRLMKRARSAIAWMVRCMVCLR